MYNHVKVIGIPIGNFFDEYNLGKDMQENNKYQMLKGTQ
jgi:hypothetical protein